MSVQTKIANEEFTDWAREAEPRVRRALTAGFGPQTAQDATAEAMALAWQRWEMIQWKENPLGYVFGIGRNCARRLSRSTRPTFPPVTPSVTPDVEPGLPGALAELSERQRMVVGLVHGYGWTLGEVADLLGTSKTTIQNHAERGLARLRTALGVDQLPETSREAR